MSVILNAFLMASLLTAITAAVMWATTRVRRSRKYVLRSREPINETKLILATNELLIAVGKSNMEFETKMAWRKTYLALQVFRSGRAALREFLSSDEDQKQSAYTSDLQWMSTEDALFAIEQIENNSGDASGIDKVAVNQ